MNFGDSNENKFQNFCMSCVKNSLCLLQAFIENTFCQNIVESLCILIIALYPNQTCKSRTIVRVLCYHREKFEVLRTDSDTHQVLCFCIYYVDSFY